MTGPTRIAMWSGPRNLSTAMMRSFGARDDTVCIDEPFYAAFLHLTGQTHPMQAEILARHETDANKVAHAMAAGDLSRPIVYQKHMTHHMVDGVPRGWMSAVRHAFLIRHPARVLASYTRKMETVTLDAIGFVQQWELYRQAEALTGSTPVVIDADDILADPESSLIKLCNALGIPFQSRMLVWSPGSKPEDGAWAPHWYDAVNASTGFGAPPRPLPELPADMARIRDDALPIYERLQQYAL